MCGRYLSSLPPELIARVFHTINVPPNFPANYNLPHSQLAPVVRRQPASGERHLGLLRWGLLPHFATDPKRQHPINARAESVATSGMFRQAFGRRRCLVPAAAFYEWRKIPGGGKQPYAVAHADDAPLALAGIREGWRAVGRGRAHLRDRHHGCQRAHGVDP
jgi:putative SOS response-associated peptidase YedK